MEVIETEQMKDCEFRTALTGDRGVESALASLSLLSLVGPRRFLVEGVPAVPLTVDHPCLGDSQALEGDVLFVDDVEPLDI
jgi:hypothetical protein